MKRFVVIWGVMIVVLVFLLMIGGLVWFIFEDDLV